MPKFVEKLRTDNYQGAEVYRVDGLLGNEIDTFITEGTEIPELSLFATRVKKACRGCELRQQDAVKHGQGRWYVHMTEDVFCMGYIRVDDYSTDNTLYIVGSARVSNNKYGSYQDKYRECSSTNPDRAEKNAKKYLQRLTPVDIVMTTKSVAESAIHRYVSDASDKWSASHTDCFGYGLHSNQATDNSMLKEMYHLLDKGHTFVDVSFKAKLIEARTAHMELKQAKKERDSDMYAIRVYERMGKQMCDVMSIPAGVVVGRRDTFVGTVPPEELPEGTLGRLSALAICEFNTYIPQVGFRYDESIFYVTC